VEDFHPVSKVRVVLSPSVPFPADVASICVSKGGGVPAEPANQPSVATVSLQDIGLSTQVGLSLAGPWADPAAVAEADDLLGLLPAPHRLCNAFSKSAEPAREPVIAFPWGEAGHITCLAAVGKAEVGESTAQRAFGQARHNRQPGDGNRGALALAACDVRAQRTGVKPVGQSEPSQIRRGGLAREWFDLPGERLEEG
jgi:hypothetical protein